MSAADTSVEDLLQSLEGCLLGTAAGDSVGLPFENLSRRAVGWVAREPLRQSLVAGWGMVSDDTEHTLMVALSLFESGPDVELFRRRLAARCRWWLLAAPPGVGSATARGILKLWLGWRPDSSGVRSAGNGPSMRAALLGVVFGQDAALLSRFVEASTRITHTDPRAFEAALAVAVAADCAARLGPVPPTVAARAFSEAYGAALADPTVLAREIQQLEAAVAQGLTVREFASRLGCEAGVTGYALHTVPVALYAWMRHAGDFGQAVSAVVMCGGDTDSTAAITGAVVGAGLGPAGVPQPWLARLLEWPRNVAWMKRLAHDLAMSAARGQGSPSSLASRAGELAWLPWTFMRNLLMLAVVLCVFFRRLAVCAVGAARAAGR